MFQVGILPKELEDADLKHVSMTSWRDRRATGGTTGILKQVLCRFKGQTYYPATNPDAHAHWKLYPPRCPVTSTTSPTTYNPGTSLASMVLEESSFVSTPPRVTSAFP